MLCEELVDTPGPVRLTSLPASGAEPAPLSSSTSPNTNSASASAIVANGGRLAMPKELWRLVDALYSSGALREKDLFMEGVNIAKDSDESQVR